MASENKKGIFRSVSRFFRFLGSTSSSEIADHGRKYPYDSVNYGLFSLDELKHMDGLADRTGRPVSRPKPTEETIGQYLESVSDSTHSKIRELQNLTCVAPEIKLASRVIASTILSPTDLQTNKTNITINYEGLSLTTKNAIIELLNKYFNNEYHLATKLAQWIKTAGFDEGAKAILIMPKHELDVQNAIQDALTAHESIESKAARSIQASTEDLYIPANTGRSSRYTTDRDKVAQEQLNDLVDAEITSAVESLGISELEIADKLKHMKSSAEDNNTKISSTQDLVKSLREGTFKLLRRNNDGTVVVTRDLNYLKKGAAKNAAALGELLKDAESQMTGFKMSEDGRAANVSSNIRCLSISDTIKLGDKDLPLIIELPADSVIPVCAPRDHNNHIGYFILIDEDGQPLSGKDNYFRSGSTDVSNRLAMQAAKGVYGNATLSSFSELANNPQVVLRNMTDVFTVAVNKLLEAKLQKTGLSGLNINMHNAVGRALFMNLLAKNRVRMVFVPEPMMVYYCFDHRADGTGKTFVEDISQMLALRTTFMVARLMAAVDNATLHRTIEVDLDEKDTNPLQTMQMVVRQALSKYAPAFSTEVQTAAESIISRNISVKPKSMAGTTDNLSVSIDKSYGNSQAPDADLMDKLNNWIGMGLGGLPASVLNQLGENEFSRSVATTNMYFANQISEWQQAIKPVNKKFVTLSVSCNSRLIADLTNILKDDAQGEPDKLRENTSADVVDTPIDVRLKEIIASIEVDLPPPQMAVKKAHFEEIQSFADSVEKIIGIIYSDDTVVDDDLKGNMNMIRSVILSRLLREFLPKLGCNVIADIPEPSAIDADYATQLAAYINNVKRRIKNLSDMAKGALPINTESAAVGPDDLGGEQGGESEGNEDQAGEPAAPPGF